jgi:hypothetical protein
VDEIRFALHINLITSKLQTPLLFGILLRVLMPTNWNASSRRLQSFVLVVSFKIPITVMLIHCTHM